MEQFSLDVQAYLEQRPVQARKGEGRGYGKEGLAYFDRMAGGEKIRMRKLLEAASLSKPRLND